jgi:hypothetical protein
MNRLFLAFLTAGAMATTACDTSATDSSATDTSPAWACPEPTDSCMNEENHQECLDVVATCEGEILIMESCPLQFGCDD